MDTTDSPARVTPNGPSYRLTVRGPDGRARRMVGVTGDITGVMVYHQREEQFAFHAGAISLLVPGEERFIALVHVTADPD